MSEARKNSTFILNQGRVPFRYITLINILIAIILPMLIRHFTTEASISQPTQYNTAIGSIIALMIGVVSYQRLHVFPGITSGGYIFMSFSAAFSVLSVVLLLMRVEYSGWQFTLSYIISTAVCVYIHQKFVVRHRMRVGVVPSPETSNLPILPKIDWVPLHLGQSGVCHAVEMVVADLHNDHSDDWDEQITRMVMSGIPVYHFKQILEQTTGRIEINNLSENTLGSLNPNDFYLKVKSIADVIIAAILLVLTAPLICLICILVRIESSGPSLFRQQRTGYRKQIFTLYKIRTMKNQDPGISDADTRHSAMTQIGDPRITRLGSFLRRSRLDELPQLINIVKGEMSLIGPRPEAVALSEWYEKEISFYHYRHIIKPGVTGWAQINQGHVTDVTDIREKLHLDFYYVKNFSMWLDILIVIGTIRTIISGKGAR